jgi:hypothetical protein
MVILSPSRMRGERDVPIIDTGQDSQIVSSASLSAKTIRGVRRIRDEIMMTAMILFFDMEKYNTVFSSLL